MVMRKNRMTKNLMQSIRRSFGRYIAIAIIIALGGAMFVGLRSTKMDMVATGAVYMQAQNMFDLRLVSAVGWDKDHVTQVARMDGVVDAEGMYYTDLIVNRGEDAEGSVYRFHTIPETVDKLVLLQGRMPEKGDECLADGFRNGEGIIGSTITIAENNAEEALENLNYRSFMVVGIVSTPLYMDMNRGNTSVGSGSISNYFFVPEEAFNVDYYTEIHVTIPGEYEVYTDAYNDAMTAYADLLKPQLEPLAAQRLKDVKAEALEKLTDGEREYAEGEETYLSEKRDAITELSDGLWELVSGEQLLRRSEQQLIDGEKAISDGWDQLEAGKKKLEASKTELESGRLYAKTMVGEGTAVLMENYTMVSQKQRELKGLKALADLKMLEIKTRLCVTPEGSQAHIAAEQEKAELDDQLAQLYDGEKQLNDAMSAIQAGLAEIRNQQQSMDEQFRDAERQIKEGQAQLTSSEAELKRQEKLVADGWIELEESKQTLLSGAQEFRDGKQEAMDAFRDAEAELRDARQELDDGWESYRNLTKSDVYVLDRNTNMGYNSLNSSSDIVAGVSKVFPVFFLLVAALVCITTMTRMVEEERTQIGTLKALGYGSFAIMSKYLIYAGSSAVLGCILGVAAGSIVFPTVLWEAYKIMIFITPKIQLRFDWQLAALVVVMYTVAMLLVTWYCCYKALREVPAELIRPKAPAAGKALLMERLPFWKNISFLNKVAIRNIFRYRQRLAMMLLGIGGCTALLMTGFGLRDTIEKIVDVQFREVTTYDMEVYFRHGCSEEEEAAFRQKMSNYSNHILFFNQISGEISANHQTRDIYLISAGDGIAEFFDFHRGKAHLELPGKDEVLLSAGMADIMGIHTGDAIVMRNPDMEELNLTVSGIYDNHVYNYAIVKPETIEHQWGRTPEKQMAFVDVRQGRDPYAAGAAASKLDNVMNVTVSEQMADMVNTMMKALDLVVIVVVICAGLLAVIVLYNLTNININERIREIATIKVLGFNAMESAMYVFKENLVLSIMGTLVGIPMGKLLLDFVISQIKIDMIWLKARLEMPSLIISVVLTVLSAVIVDILFYYKLEKINMAEALKSVE